MFATGSRNTGAGALSTRLLLHFTGGAQPLAVAVGPFFPNAGCVACPSLHATKAAFTCFFLTLTALPTFTAFTEGPPLALRIARSLLNRAIWTAGHGIGAAGLAFALTRALSSIPTIGSIPYRCGVEHHIDRTLRPLRPWHWACCWACLTAIDSPIAFHVAKFRQSATFRGIRQGLLCARRTFFFIRTCLPTAPCAFRSASACLRPAISTGLFAFFSGFAAIGIVESFGTFGPIAPHPVTFTRQVRCPQRPQICMSIRFESMHAHASGAVHTSHMPALHA